MKKVVLLVLLISSILSGCGTNSKLENSAFTPLPTTSNTEEEPPFEIINDSITLECGDSLSADITTYVKSEHPENIIRSGLCTDSTYWDKQSDDSSNIPFEATVFFKNTDTLQEESMTVTVIDTIPPVVELPSNEFNAYTKGYILALDEIVPITQSDSEGRFINIIDSATITDNTYCEYKLQNFDTGNDPYFTGNADIRKISPELVSGDYKDILIVTDRGGNTVEIPVIFHLIDDVSPEDKVYYEKYLKDKESAENERQKSMDELVKIQKEINAENQK